MDITDVRVYLRNGQNNLKGFASVTLDGSFAVKDLRILETQKGLFVMMPSRKDRKGKYYDVAHPVTREFYDTMQSQVLEAYKRATRGT